MVYAVVDIEKQFAPAKNFGTVASILNLIIPLLTIAGGLLFVGMMLFGAFTIITAGGDAERVKKAQKTFKFAVVGLVIVLTAYLAVTLIGMVFNIKLPL